MIMGIAVLALSFAVVLIYESYGVSLMRSQYLTGWTLLSLVIFLALYNVRKKLPFLPLGSASGWFRAHLLAGWFCVLFFLIHVEMRLPNGPVETALAVILAGLVFSGLFGFWISRSFPSRLTRHGSVFLSAAPSGWGKISDDVIYERIPEFYRKIRERAEMVVIRSSEVAESTTIPDFYVDRLDAFFGGPRNFWLHVVGSNRPLATILNEIKILDPYLNPEEKEISKELRDLVRLKHHMDFHHALQGLLKQWLFVHIPLTYVLALFIIVHVVLVYAFSIGNS